MRGKGFPLGAALAVTLVFVAVPTGPAGAHDDEGTHVETLTASVSGTSVNATGTAAFIDLPVLVGEDGTGDAAQSGIGADVTTLTIGRPDPTKNTLTFTMGIADQAPAVNGAPTIIYTWPLSVDDVSEGYFLEARNASANQPTQVNPSFSLQQETPDGIATIAAVQGTMGDGKVEWNLPFGRIAAAEGQALFQAGDCVGLGSGLAAPGLLWFCGNNGGDGAFMDLDYVIPAPGVKLGIAPAGTPESQVSLNTTAAIDRATGAFNGSIDASGLAPGSYVVVARACYGTGNCGTASTSVSI